MNAFYTPWKKSNQTLFLESLHCHNPNGVNFKIALPLAYCRLWQMYPYHMTEIDCDDMVNIPQSVQGHGGV